MAMSLRIALSKANPIALQRLPHGEFDRWEGCLVEYILDALHRCGEELLIEDTAFHYFKRAGQTFRSELVLHGLHIGACTRGEIVQHPHPMAAS